MTEHMQALIPTDTCLEISGFSLLHKTVLEICHLDLETMLRNLPRSAIDEVDANGRTALWWACRLGDYFKVSLLIRFGADYNKRSHALSSPLNEAIYSRHRGCIRLLLGLTSKINFFNSQGWTPLHCYCYFCKNADIVLSFLQRGVSIDATSRSGETPLCLAVHDGSVEMVKCLISQGASLNLTTDEGESALHRAVWYNSPDIIPLLLQYRVDYRLKTNLGETILHYAAQYGSIECLEALKAANLIGLNPQDLAKGLTALQMAGKRQAVTPEWLATFRRLVQGIERRNEHGPDDATEAELDEEFVDAVEHQ